MKEKRKRIWNRAIVSMLILVQIICSGCSNKEDKNKEPDILHFGDTAGVVGTAKNLIGEITGMGSISAPKIKVPNTTPDENGNYYKNTIGSQGAYFDGRYLYQSFIAYCFNQDVKYQSYHQINNRYNLVVIVKYDMVKKEVVLTSEPLMLNHAADITFNSKLGYLVVNHGAPNLTTVSYLKPDTLEIVETFQTENTISGIAYNPKTDQYAVSISNTFGFVVTDGNLKNISDFHAGIPESWAYTRQAITCDENYVYCLLYGPETSKLDGSILGTDAITVYDWEGNFVSFIEFDLGAEPESLNIINGDIYVGTSMGKKAYIFRISSLKPEQ